MKKIKLIELFAGIGAQAKALENIDEDLKRHGYTFEHYNICEFDKYAVTSYNAIHGTNFKPSDITAVNSFDIGLDTKPSEDELVLMTYSFPCTSISLSGKRTGYAKGSNTESSLLWEVKRILEEAKYKPGCILMENVTQVHSSKYLDVWNEWLEFLSSLGYVNCPIDLNAKDFDVPQNRNRCYMLSFQKNVLKPQFNISEDELIKYITPSKKPLKHALCDVLDDIVKEKFYLSEKSIQSFVKSTQKAKEKGNGFEFKPFDPSDVDVSKCLTSSPATRGYGNFIKDEVEVVGRIDGKYDIIRRVYNQRGISPTITTMNGGGHEPKIFICDDTQGFDGNRIYNDYSPSLRSERNGLKVCSMAMRGRYKEDGSTEQQFEKRKDDVSNCITTVQKDSLILMKSKNGLIEVVGNYMPSGHESSRVLKENGICSTVKENHSTVNGVLQDVEIAPIIKEKDAHKNIPIVEDEEGTLYTIRKLTPKEFLRLMSFTDDDYEKMRNALINEYYNGKDKSDSRIYKQAGNSIVVKVLEELFKKMLEVIK